MPTEDEPQYWAMEQRLLLHASKYLEYIRHGIDVESSDNRDIYRAIHKLASLYTDQGKMQEAEAIYRQALKGYEKAWRPEHTSTLNMVNNLGILYKNQGKM